MIQRRIFIQSLLIAICAFLMVACSHVLYPKRNALSEIKTGMSPREVTALLGEPEHRRLDHDLEEWEYRKILSPLDNEDTVIILRFERGRLTYMDSFKPSQRHQSPPPVPHKPRPSHHP